MTAYDEALDCLKQMHAIIRKNNLTAYNMDRSTYRSLDDTSRHELDRNIKFMKEEGWIKPHTLCAGLPISYTLTSLGIKVAEGIIQNSSIHQTTYHIGTAQNSIIGANAHNNTFNVGTSFDELQSLIEQNIASQPEKDEILDVIRELQDSMSENKPLEKGILVKISDKLESCSWLSSGVAALVLQYLSSLASK